jgi:ABC-type dipeptide/oligopeptide/nickel transport system permease component
LLFGGLTAQVFVILSVTFIVTSATSAAQYADLHVLYRYVLYIRDLLTFSLGETSEGIPAGFYIVPSIARSVLVLLPSLLMAASAVMLLVRNTAIHRGALLQRSAGSVSALGYSVPIPFIAVLLFALAGATDWFPLGMTSSVNYEELSLPAKIWDRIHHLILPWVTLGIFPFLSSLRAVERRYEHLRDAPIVTAARARGLSRRLIYRHHLRRPLLAELLEHLAGAMPILITYLALVETVYRYTGLGFYLIGPYASGRWSSPTGGLIVSQAALVYVAIFSVLAQFLFRTLETLLIPQLRGGSAKQSTDRSWFIIGIAGLAAMVGVAAGLLPQIPTPAPALLRVVATGIVVAALLVLLIRGRAAEDREPRGVAPRSRMPAVRKHDGPAHTEEQGQQRRHKWRASLLRHYLAHNRRAVRRIVVGAAGLVLFMGAGILVGEPEPLSRMAALRPQATPLGPRLLFHLQAAVSTARSLPMLIAVATLGVFAAAAAACASVFARPPFLDRGIKGVTLFPALLIVAMLLNLTGGAAAYLYAFLLIAIAHQYGAFRDRLTLLRQESFVTYSRTLGRGFFFILRRHIWPNLRRPIAHASALVAADLLVLRANLRFVGIRRPYDLRRAAAQAEQTGRSSGASEGVAGGLLDSLLGRLFGPDAAPIERILDGARQVVANMYSESWGNLVQNGVRGFIRGYYLPVVFPLAMLLATVALLRLVAAGISDLERT